MLNKLSKIYYDTTIDLMMGYYNIFLTDVDKKICTITKLFGKYKYYCLPMGVCIAPYISRANEHYNGRLRVC